MKFFVIIVISVFCGLFFWYGMLMESSIHGCTTKYADDLSTSRVQIDSIRSDHQLYCSTSLDMITSWEECVKNQSTNTPYPFLNTQIKPIVLKVMHIVGDPSGNIEALKLDHDDACKDQSTYMFYPPQPTQ